MYVSRFMLKIRKGLHWHVHRGRPYRTQ